MPEVVALSRLSIAEAERFPELAELGVRIGKGAAIRSMAAAFHGEPNPTEEGLAAHHGAAFRFVEITISPLLLRALSGEDLEALRQEASHYVAAALPDNV